MAAPTPMRPTAHATQAGTSDVPVEASCDVEELAAGGAVLAEPGRDGGDETGVEVALLRVGELGCDDGGAGAVAVDVRGTVAEGWEVVVGVVLGVPVLVVDGEGAVVVGAGLEVVDGGGAVVVDVVVSVVVGVGDPVAVVGLGVLGQDS